MFDVAGISDAFEFIKGAAAGSAGTMAMAYVYSKRAAIAALFKRAEGKAEVELHAFREALVNLENRAREGFGVMSSVSKTISADVAAAKQGVADVSDAVASIKTDAAAIHDRLVKVERAVFGDAGAALLAAGANAIPVAPVTAVAGADPSPTAALAAPGK